MVAAAMLTLAVALAPSTSWASPPDQTWTEDIHLHQSGPAELGMLYSVALRADNFGVPSIDLVTLRTLAGFDRAPMDWSPSIGLINIDGFGTQLFHVGLRARYRLLGSTGQPTLGLALGYQLTLFDGHQHRAEQRLAGILHANPSFGLAWEVGLQEHFGDQIQVEGRISAAATYGFAINLVRLSFETFVLLPLTGERITDFAVGRDRDNVAIYLGPGLRLNLENYLWLSGSVVTGALVGGGAPAMVRVAVGTQF